MFLLRYFVLSLFVELGWAVTEREIAALPPFYHMDDYDNCVLHDEDALYCKIKLELFPTNNENVSVWNIMTELQIDHFPYTHAICLTQRCPQLPKTEILQNTSAFLKEVTQCYGGSYKHLGLGGNITSMTCRNKSPIDLYDVIFGIIIIAIIGLVLFAWLYDTSNNSEVKTSFDKYISCFSLGRNWKRLTTVDVIDPDVEAFSCLQGVRVLNCSLVIIIHASILFQGMPSLNSWLMLGATTDDLVPIYLYGIMYNQMQPFFFLSAWLLTFNFLKEIQRKNGKTFGQILHRLLSRYLRLTPLMIMSVFSIATWVTHMSDGPLWDETLEAHRKACRNKWWRKLLYLLDVSSEVDEICMPHLWSQNVDFYLHITILVVLWVAYKNPKKILRICGGIWCFHILSTLLILRVLDSTDFALKGNVAKAMIIYSLTITNVPAALSGAAFGYFYYDYKETLFTTKKSVWTTWIFILITACVGLFMPLITLNDVTSNSAMFFTIYFCLTRTFVNIALGLFILVLVKGRGGVLRKILASKAMYILGRLTYAAYIIHPFIMDLKVGFLRAPIFLNNYLMLFDSLMDIIVSFSVAVPVTLFFEMPFDEVKVYIIKAMRKRESKTKKSD